MKIHRFYIETDLDQKVLGITDKDLIKQMHRVLELKKGEHIILFDGSSFEANATITSITKDKVQLDLSPKRLGLNEPKNRVYLYPSIIKKDNFEVVTEKSVECGVNEITPIITSRTIKKNLSVERLRKIAKEALEQSERSLLVKINEIENFEKALSNSKGVRLICTKNGVSFKNIPKSSEYSIFIGPEGGFSDSELELATTLKAVPFSLGKTTLRAETASIIATYLLSNA